MTLVADGVRPITFNVIMQKSKTTKNTVVYTAPDGEPITTLYVQRNVFTLAGIEHPATITVTVDSGNTAK